MIIFTDASFSKQTKTAGFGFVIVDKQFDFKAGNYSFECKNNNIAELQCIEEAVKYCLKFNLFKATKDKTLTIISDSKFAVDRILGHIKCQDSKEQKLQSNISYMLKQCPLKTTIFQIKGHQKGKDKFSYYNEVADCIASDYRYLGEIELEKQKLNNKINGGR